MDKFGNHAKKLTIERIGEETREERSHYTGALIDKTEVSVKYYVNIALATTLHTIVPPTLCVVGDCLDAAFDGVANPVPSG